MKKTFLLVAAICVSANAQPLMTAEPKGTIYLDDTIVLRVSPEGEVGTGSIKLQTQNLTIDGPWDHIVGEKKGDYWRYTHIYTVTPKAAGPAWIEGYVQSPNKPISENFSRITFNVLPDIARSTDDPAVIFARQRAAGRPLFYIRANANTRRAYVGQRVEVSWDAITAADDDIQPQGWYPPLKESDYETVSSDHDRIKSAAGGMIVWRHHVAHIALTSWTPGTLHIPESLVQAVQASAGWKPGFVHRWAPALDIEFVQPPAEAANLPMGKFTLRCSPGVNGYWQEFSLLASGDGYLSKAPAPRFDFQPSVPIVARVATGARRSTEIEWEFSVHSHNEVVELPPVSFDYFDPEANAVRHATCLSTRAARRYITQPTHTPARRAMNIATPESLTISRTIAGFFALVGLAMVLTAARP